MIAKILFASLILGSSPLSAQSASDKRRAEAELERVIRLAKPSIPQFREAIRPLLTDSEREIEQATTIEIVDSWEVQARARRDEDGQRIIEMNGGLVEILDWISTSIAAIGTDYPDCAHKYATYLFSEIDTNSTALAFNEDRDPVYPPFEYARQHPDSCDGVTEALITEDPRAKQMRLIGLGSSMHWVLSHELAHHLHGDTSLEFHDPPTATELKRSRDNEYRADKFAFTALSQPGFDPLGAMPAYLFIGIRGAAAEDEEESTHPSGPRRFRILFQALESRTTDPQFRAYLRSSGQLEKWRTAMDKMRIFSQQ